MFTQTSATIVSRTAQSSLSSFSSSSSSSSSSSHEQQRHRSFKENKLVVKRTTNQRRQSYLSSTTTSSSQQRLQRYVFNEQNLNNKNKNKNKNTETIVRAQKKNEEDDEYLFKNTTNAGGKGGVLDRENPMLEEKFAVIGEGEHECQSCMYQYSPKKGDDFYPISAGTPFKDLPEDWNCPVCGASKAKFKSIGKKVAGFEQNQGYGFGTNSMTEGEKSTLIYGSLALFLFLFLAGYLLE